MKPLSSERLAAALSGLEVGPFGENLHYLAQIGSTNDVARQLALDGAPEGTVIITDHQTAGRGCAGRTWSAPANTSLLMTVVFRPVIPAEQVNRLVMVVGLAVADAVESLVPCRVDVKWPNDLQIDGKKFTGVLPESSLMGDVLEWVLVGVGVNVNQQFGPGDSLAETATSVCIAAGKDLDRAVLFGRIMQQVYRWRSQLVQFGGSSLPPVQPDGCIRPPYKGGKSERSEGEPKVRWGVVTDSSQRVPGENNLVEAWRDRCVTLNQRIRVTISGRTVVGLAEDIDVNGALMVRDDQGQLHRLTIGEAQMLRSAD
jgi:BirA family biotin operon repressor/biotin-[acetyl-CoA-carboxylase] ligase